MNAKDILTKNLKLETVQKSSFLLRFNHALAESLKYNHALGPIERSMEEAYQQGVTDTRAVNFMDMLHDENVKSILQEVREYLAINWSSEEERKLLLRVENAIKKNIKLKNQTNQ